MWLQGLDQAPDVIKKCYASWEKHNADWEIVLLDKHNLEEHIRIQEIVGKNREYISRQALADVARINLLARYGGVWVDSTCFCCMPLDEWLNKYTDSGFFAFDRPRKNKPLSSWFMASSANCYLTSRFCKEVNTYWSRNCFSNQKLFLKLENKRVVKLLLGKALDRKPSLARLWFSFVVSKILKVYPYHWFHYLFAEVLRKDKLCRKVWSETGSYSADVPHKLQSSGLFKPIPKKLKRDIDSRKDPLYKLIWKYDESVYVKGCTLDYLLRSI